MTQIAATYIPNSFALKCSGSKTPTGVFYYRYVIKAELPKICYNVII